MMNGRRRKKKKKNNKNKNKKNKKNKKKICLLLGYIADGPQDRASDNFMPHMRQSLETMTAVSAGPLY